MNRRTYLGACAGASLVGMSGCIGTVASRVTNTEAAPAFHLARTWQGSLGAWREPHSIRPIDEAVEAGALGTLQVRGWLTGSQLRATSHNASRSNRSSGLAAPDGDGDDGDDGEKAQDYNSSRSNKPRSTREDSDDGDGTGDGNDRAQNHNSSRSNRTQPLINEGDGSDTSIELDRAFEYLSSGNDMGVVAGEVFVVTVPAVDFPGVTDSPIKADVDYVKNMVAGARSASPTSEETVLRDLTTPTRIRCCLDKASPSVGLSAADDTDEPIAGALTEMTLRGETGAPDQSEPVVGRAVATLDEGVRLPVLVWSQHLVHEGDHVFVAGWAVDEARLYTNAATVLTATGRTDVAVFGLAPDEIEAAASRLRGRDGRLWRSQNGALPDTEDDLGSAVLETAKAARRTPPESDDDWMGLFVVPIDTPVGHFVHQKDFEYEDAWEEAARQ